jgi:hypothetical protein
MDKRKILIQLDSDPQPSVFDRIVALDAGADEVFSYGAVEPEQVRNFVHGAIFTRGAKDLNRTAFFVGGSDVGKGERLFEEVNRHLLPQFGLRVSILLDANGANTTAAAVVRVAARHLDLHGLPVLLLGGTGPVGQRVARLLATQGAEVLISSLDVELAASACKAIQAKFGRAHVRPVATSNPEELAAALAGRVLVIGAGAAGVMLLPAAARKKANGIRIAIDLNAVPPLGIEGVEVTDKGVERDGVVCYGAIGIGDTKMKIHKAAIARLFENNEQAMDAEEVYLLASTVSP